MSRVCHVPCAALGGTKRQPLKEPARAVSDAQRALAIGRDRDVDCDVPEARALCPAAESLQMWEARMNFVYISV